MWLLDISGGSNALSLDPCRLACHLEHSVDICKLVESADDQYCKNLYWAYSNKTSLFVDIVQDEDDIRVLVSELVGLLKAEKGGCEQMCKAHDECIHIGSNCKPNDTCMNLFWNKSHPVASEMSTCYEYPGNECYDAVPVLCGPFLNNPTPTNVSNGPDIPTIINSQVPDEAKTVAETQRNQVTSKSAHATDLALLSVYAIYLML